MGSAAYRTASIRRPRASTPVSGSARRRSQFEVRVWACRDARRRRRSSGRVRLTEFQQHVGVRHRACHVATDGSRTDRPARALRLSKTAWNSGTCGGRCAPTSTSPREQW